MNPLVVIGVIAVCLAALVAYRLYNNKQELEAHKVKPVGDKVFPGGNPPAEEVDIGPTLWDGPHSVGMPLHPTPHPSGVGWIIKFPLQGQGKVDYVEFNHGPLTGKSKIVIDYELTLAEGVGVYATPQPDMSDTSDPKAYRAQMTPHFQEAGDDWSGIGKYESYRWYGYTSDNYLKPGANTLEISLIDGNWKAVEASTREKNPDLYKAAIDNACAVGVVFGGNGIGIGHGADASGDAVLWVKKFSVE